ncbi:MAG: Bax inhibitor-1 family protein [Bacilli bacterium]
MNTFTPEKTVAKPIKESKQAVFSMGRVIAWFGLGLLITGLVAFFFPDILILACGTENLDLLNTVYLVSIIVSAVLLLVCSIGIWVKTFRKNSWFTKVFYFIYTLAMGVLLSNVLLMIFSINEKEFLSTVAIAFFATAGCFVVMGIIASFIKNDSILIPFIVTLLIGCLVISLVNFFLKSELVYWIIDFVVFACILLQVGFDIKHVKQLADVNAFTSNTNLAIYSAYVLYVDFIYIFIKILYYVAIAKSKNN